MKRISLPLALLIGGSMLTSCASIAAPGPDMVHVTSTPPEAEVYLDGRLVGKTPTPVAVDRDSEGVFSLKLDGFKTARLDRDRRSKRNVPSTSKPESVTSSA